MWFEPTYTLLGGLGIFFFGMKTLSESLQGLSGNLIRRVIHLLTSNRLVAVGVGMAVTTIIQSSSVTTVMVVGLVNAKLMELTQAIGVIFGANIGTTVTGWIIAIDIGKYGLLLVGLGIFPLLLSKSRQFKLLGSTLLALGFIFMGLEYMATALKPLSKSEMFHNLLVYFSAESLPSLLACIGMGAVLTMVVQSSSAMLGVTIALASTGSITFQTAAGLVLGENIGTTITAILASVGASSNAKRAARAHATFNVVAVLVLVPLFWHYIDLVDWLIDGDPNFLDAQGNRPLVAAHIAAGHSMFNIMATCFWLPLLKPLAAFVTWLTPTPAAPEIAHLKFISPRTEMESPPLALAAVEKEVQNLAEITRRSLKLTRSYLLAEKPDAKHRDKVMEYETIADSIQAEITLYIRRVHQGRLTEDLAAFAYALIRVADELESVTDYCASLVRARDRLSASEETLTGEAMQDLTLYADAAYDYFREVQRALAHGHEIGHEIDVKAFQKKHEELVELGNQIRDRHRERIRQQQCAPQAGMVFSDLIVGLRKLKGHALNVVEAIGLGAA